MYIHMKLCAPAVEEKSEEWNNMSRHTSMHEQESSCPTWGRGTDHGGRLPIRDA